MAKKVSLTNPITYLGNPANTSAQIINQIPNFENPGVRYQGYCKIDKGNGSFELRQQQTRFYSLKFGNTGVFDNSFARSQPSKKFYAATISIDYDADSSPLQVTIYDGAIANPKFRCYLDLGAGHFSIDLSNCPRQFAGSTIIISTDATLGGAHFINVNLFGWEED